MLVRWLVPVSAIVLGAACSFAPHYARPATQSPPPAYQEEAGWVLARPCSSAGRASTQPASSWYAGGGDWVAGRA